MPPPPPPPPRFTVSPIGQMCVRGSQHGAAGKCRDWQSTSFTGSDFIKPQNYSCMRPSRGPDLQKKLTTTQSTIFGWTMSLSETLTLWDGALAAWDGSREAEALKLLSQIKEPSSKILFNFGTAHLCMGDVGEALKVRDFTCLKC